MDLLRGQNYDRPMEFIGANNFIESSSLIPSGKETRTTREDRQ